MEFLTKRQERFYRNMEKTPLGRELLTDWFMIAKRKRIAYYEDKIAAAIRNYKENEEWLGDEKAVRRARRAIIFSMFAYGILPDEYFMFRFAYLSPKGKDSFITDKVTVANLHKLNDYAYLNLFNNKYETYKVYGEYYGRQMLILKSEEDRAAFLEFAGRNPSFVRKGQTGACGRGVNKFSCADYPSNDALFDHFMEEVAETGPVVVEELIPQSDIMSSLNPTSVNGIRLLTLLGDDGEVIYKYPFIKIGRNGSFVDNGGAGGLLALIDEKTGIVVTKGIAESGESFAVHPDTGTPIPGFQIPDWEQALELGRKLAPITPRVRYIGWDIAHTDSGWVVVEGNFASMFIGQQMCDQIGKRKEFCEIVDNLKDLEKTE
ncbi:MAG: hypothetical protein IKT01_07385 [Eubacteriaceae bacterium]|nr:hypothetical protein [Eubacteriaceae bacterium]